MENTKEKHYLKHLDAKRKIILKSVLTKKYVNWTQGQAAGFCEHGNESTAFITGGKGWWLLASQKLSA
jgi:hypothetical protein